jgi:hypothetical protein
MDAMPPCRLTKEWLWHVDALFDAGDPAIYQAAIDRLRDTGSIAETARLSMESEDSLGISLDEHGLGHFVDDWLGGRYWPDKLVEPVLRAGFIRAMETARDFELPMNTVWVHGGPDFQVYVLEGSHQITTLIYSPAPPPNFGPPEGGGHPQVQLIRARNFNDDDGAEMVDDIEGVVVQRYGTPTAR